jgi:hypothetical protein
MAENQQEIEIRIPDLGLSQDQLNTLKEQFQNQVVSAMGKRSPAETRIVIVVIRVVRAS